MHIIMRLGCLVGCFGIKDKGEIMSGLSKVGILLGIFAIVNYIIGVLRTYKLTKKFMLPNVPYFAGIFKSCANVIKALSGIAPPGRTVERGDRNYYKPTYDEFYEALVVVHQMMKDGGWNIKDYKASAKDCEDYSMKMAVELRNYIATTFPTEVAGKGVAIGMLGYVVEKSGNGHAIVDVYLDNGERKYYQPFPAEAFLTEINLTQRELDSIMMDIM